MLSDARVRNLRQELHQLSADSFTGESILRFQGERFESMNSLPKEIRRDDRPQQDVEIILAAFLFLHSAKAFGTLNLIWSEGKVKNYTVKLTFQGSGVPQQIKGILRIP